jgi:hypothetical protein
MTGSLAPYREIISPLLSGTAMTPASRQAASNKTLEILGIDPRETREPRHDKQHRDAHGRGGATYPRYRTGQAFRLQPTP